MRIKISFLGAVQNVTGSRHLLEVDGLKVLVDCGLHQERPLADRNWDRFPVEPKDIDAVLLTHAHLDHCGLLPKLVREGFAGKIICTHATAEIAMIILLDSAKIQVEDAAYKARRHEREGRKGAYPIRPLYTVEDAEKCIPMFETVDYRHPVKIGENANATFHDAGHVLGSSMITVSINRNGENRTILFSGDIGRTNMPILEDPTVFAHADYVLVESTYGDRLHGPVKEIDDQLEEIINSTKKAGGNIVIPSFALERSQEILFHLNELLLADRIPHLMVFLDSPMAIRITEVFKKHPELFDDEILNRIAMNQSPFDFPGLNMTEATEQSKGINHIRGTIAIVAGSGMCTGGRVKHHLINNISRPESTIMFIGYQAAGTLGRQIVDGAEEVRILGRMMPVKARIAQINGFSAHADRDELTAWLKRLKKPPRGVFVVHGETQSARKFGDHLAKETGWNVTVPAYRDEIILD